MLNYANANADAENEQSKPPILDFPLSLSPSLPSHVYLLPNRMCTFQDEATAVKGTCSAAPLVALYARAHVSPRERFNEVNLASTLLMRSGSGAGCTLRGGARGHFTQRLWPHRVQARGSMVEPRACPSGLLG